jgi:hypothetical protein
VSAAAGQALLRRALSGGGMVIQVQSPSAAFTTYRATIPPGAKSGDTIIVNAGGQNMSIVVPPGAAPGTEISFQAPLQAQVVQVQATPAPAPAYNAPPAAYSAPPPAAYSAPPPAAVPAAAAPPPPAIGTQNSNRQLEKKSSMNW